MPVAPTSGPRLQVLVYDDYLGRIEAGLSCNFTSADGRNIFVASGPDDRNAKANGLVRLADEFTVLPTTGPGGYSLLRQGASFAADGIFVTVDRAPGEGAHEGVESTVWPATLSISFDGGSERVYRDGHWSCGA